MTINFCCPKCKKPLIDKTNGYLCNYCKSTYPVKDGHVDFIGEQYFYAGEVPQSEMTTLLNDIDSSGYYEGLKIFLEKHPFLRDAITDVRRVGWVSHCLSKNNFRCLDIGSGLGNISECLSNIYHEVYSLEAVQERIEFQKRRFKNSNLKNVTIVRGNTLELPFPDNCFDLIVCNGVLEWMGMMNPSLSPREAQLSFLREAKRVLTSGGCLYIGIENRTGIDFLLGMKDHSGLAYTSFLPRRLANFVVKNFGYSGGIYGDKSKKIKEQRGYYTYTYTVWGYRKLFEEIGFKFKSFWVYPSYNAPYFSGIVEDNIGLKGFVRYFGSIVTRFKNILSIIEKMDKSVIGFVASILSPSFLFYCYKNEIPDSVDDMLVKNTGLESFTTINDGGDIMYLLYDKTGNPVKVAHVKRFGFDLPEVFTFYNKTNPSSHGARERIWLEDWIPGTPLNPLQLDDLRRAINWLIDFQQKTRKTTMTKEDIQKELNYIRTNLLQVANLNKPEYVKCLDEYQKYVETLKINKTAEHGDFYFRNILIESNTNKTNVIDWENYKEEGNPLFDFVFFFTGVILFLGGVEQFKSNLNGSGRFSLTVKEMKVLIENHFGYELDLEILIKYVILRYIIGKQLESGPFDKVSFKYKNALDTLLEIKT